MKQTVNYYQFEQAFSDCNRLNHFPEGLRDLFNYLQEYEESTGEEIELDVIALCCDYTEEKLQTVLEEYDIRSLDKLRDHTQVIMVGDESEDNPTIIYRVF